MLSTGAGGGACKESLGPDLEPTPFVSFFFLGGCCCWGGVLSDFFPFPSNLVTLDDIVDGLGLNFEFLVKIGEGKKKIRGLIMGLFEKRRRNFGYGGEEMNWGSLRHTQPPFFLAAPHAELAAPDAASRTFT
ncbi:hypothetical protein A2U01_0033406, partial [Trifolium medium]|nr:hypothetical protein [Trifolium medium]